MANLQTSARQGPTLEDIQEQLKKLSAPLARSVAVRTALRVLPLSATYLGASSKENANTALALIRAQFRACSLSWAASKYPAYDVTAGADMAGLATNLAAGHAANATADEAAYAGFAAGYAAEAAFNTVSDATTDAVTVTDNATKAAADDTRAAETIRASIEQDLDWIAVRSTPRNDEEAAGRLVSRRLWANDTPTWASELWKDLVSNLNRSSFHWGYWIDWYEARLGGFETSERLELAVATIDPELWRSDDINSHIAKLAEELGPLVANGAVPDTEFWPKIAQGKIEIQPDPDSTTTGTETDAEEDGEEDSVGAPAFDDTVRQTADSAASDHDFLGRSRAAYVLAGQLQQVWEDRRNADLPPTTHSMARWTHWLRRMPQAAEAGYVVHIDAPWGGGKTSFANYLTTILSPPNENAPQWLEDIRAFSGKENFPDDWRIVHFNAWQHQHMDPPWWAFYETIRKQLLRGTSLPRRIGRWALERLWRFTTPQMVERAIITMLVLAVVYILYRYNWTVIDAKTGKLKFENAGAPSVIATLGAALFGGGTVLWTFLSGIYKSLVPGTPEAAKNYSLGTGDPLERFRHHFRRFLARFRRPVLVVVDDLDRCDPKFVVGLIRGMQTILQSPRIFFVLLGDRDWIEQAFTDQHKAMQAIDVGPEHEFGARFVEKAIQLSFVLPEITEADQKEYVRKLLTRDRADSNKPEAGVTDEHVKERESIEVQLATLRQTEDLTERTTQAEQLRTSVEQTSLSAEAKTSLQRDIAVTEVLTGAVDAQVQEELELRMVGLAHLMPPNPRQIIRIINTLALVQGVAALNEVNTGGKKDFSTGGDDWQILARWIVLMTEWPKTWFTLSKHPVLMSKITGRKKKWAAEDDAPDNADALVENIRDSDAVMKLLQFQPEKESGWKKQTILQSHVEWLKDITPPTSGQLLNTGSKQEAD